MVMVCGHPHPLLTHILPDTNPRISPSTTLQFCPSTNLKPCSLRRIAPTHTSRRRGRARCTDPIASLQSQEHRKREDGVESVAPIVKMCGITSAEDAAMAARAGAKYVGMIVWPKSKRSVSVSLARDIAAAARESGAEPVGVFVEENAAEIERVCDAAGLSIAQVAYIRSLLQKVRTTFRFFFFRSRLEAFMRILPRFHSGLSRLRNYRNSYSFH